MHCTACTVKFAVVLRWQLSRVSDFSTCSSTCYLCTCCWLTRYRQWHISRQTIGTILCRMLLWHSSWSVSSIIICTTQQSRQVVTQLQSVLNNSQYFELSNLRITINSQSKSSLNRCLINSIHLLLQDKCIVTCSMQSLQTDHDYFTAWSDPRWETDPWS